MKPEHKYAQVLRWIADGKDVQAYDSQIGEFVDKAPEALLLMIFNQEAAPENFRIKPRTILINGIEVPEPLRVAPKIGSSYWVADHTHREFACLIHDYRGDEADVRWLKCGLIHATKEAAEAHARALLSFTEVKE